MPTYQYTCTECGEPLEAVQSFTDAALTQCPRCGGRLRKVFTAVGVVFKGSGFYRTDSRSGAGKGAAAASGDGSGDGGGTGAGGDGGGTGAGGDGGGTGAGGDGAGSGGKESTPAAASNGSGDKPGTSSPTPAPTPAAAPAAKSSPSPTSAGSAD